MQGLDCVSSIFSGVMSVNWKGLIRNFTILGSFMQFCNDFDILMPAFGTFRSLPIFSENKLFMYF